MNAKIANFLGRRSILKGLFGSAALGAAAASLTTKKANAADAPPAAVTFGIWTGNIERLGEFYKGLGCEVSEIHPLPAKVGPVVELAAGAAVRQCFFTYQGSRVEISEAKPLPGNTPHKPLFQAGMIHMAFKTDDVDKMMELCAKAGGKVEEKTLTKLSDSGISTVYAYDPDGTRIQFTGPSKKAV